MQERNNVVTFLGKPMTLCGKEIHKGDKAPQFTLLSPQMEHKSLADYSGKVILISTVPSLDTGVCDQQTRRFNEEAASLGSSVAILTVSCDLPFAQGRWCGAAGIKGLETLSDYYDTNFGLHYGVLIKELRLLTRAIFIIDKSGIVQYTEIVPEISNEVHFTAALAAVKSLV